MTFTIRYIDSRPLLLCEEWQVKEERILILEPLHWSASFSSLNTRGASKFRHGENLVAN